MTDIVKVFSANATDNSRGMDNVNLNGPEIREMVEAGLKTLTGKNEINDAWHTIIPDNSKKVAIKVNCQVTSIYTKAKVVDAIM